MPFLEAGFLGGPKGSGTGRGLPGKDGSTPTIGQNGNWFIGGKDTGVKASGDNGQAITHVALTGNTMTFTHGDGAKHSVVLPSPGSPGAPTGLANEIRDIERKIASQGADISALKSKFGTLDMSLKDLTGVYNWRGVVAPLTYPTDPRHSYFVNIFGSSKDLTLNMPNPIQPTVDGTLFFVDNENTEHKITVRPKRGESISNADHITLNPQQFLMLVKSGNNWVKVAIGYLPSSFTDLTNRIANSLDSELHTKPQIIQMINDWLANPATQGKIDQILKNLGYSKSGGGVQPHPSAVRIHYGVGDDYPTDFTGQTAEVATHQAMVINHLDQDPKKVWIAVPKTMASKVSGISANSGLAAQWDRKDITVTGEQWTVFLSPTPLADDTISFEIKWSV